ALSDHWSPGDCRGRPCLLAPPPFPPATPFFAGPPHLETPPPPPAFSPAAAVHAAAAGAPLRALAHARPAGARFRFGTLSAGSLGGCHSRAQHQARRGGCRHQQLAPHWKALLVSSCGPTPRRYVRRRYNAL